MRDSNLPHYVRPNNDIVPTYDMRSKSEGTLKNEDPNCIEIISSEKSYCSSNESSDEEE